MELDVNQDCKTALECLSDLVPEWNAKAWGKPYCIAANLSKKVP